jgi:hypothetical protein
MLDTFWIVLGGAVLFLALIGALGVVWLAAASLVLLGKHIVFRGNNAESPPVTSYLYRFLIATLSTQL